MSRTESPTLSHWIQYCAYRGFERVIRMMSLETVFKLGEFTGRVAFRFAKDRRYAVMRNLTYAYGEEKTASEIEELAAAVFERNGANFLSSLRVPFLKDDEIVERLDFMGEPNFNKAVTTGGAVMVSPHMGNWEMLAQALFLASSKVQIGTHYRPLNNDLIDRVVKRRRKRRGLKLFAKQDPTLRLTSFVKEGGFLGILADQRVGSKGAAGTFFGRPTTLSPLPHLVAKRGKVDMYLLYTETIGLARWRVYFDLIPGKTAQACGDALEAAWRHSPKDVFWFEDRWRVQGKKALDFLAKYPAGHRVKRPLRLVNLTGKELELEIEEGLVREEKASIDFTLDDVALKEVLRGISASGESPVDIYAAPSGKASRLKKLSGKIFVLSS